MTGTRTGTLLALGYGYSAAALGRRLLASGWRVIGTTRTPDRARALQAQGVEPLLWPGTDLGPALAQASHLLISIAPEAGGDPVLKTERQTLKTHAQTLKWAGYLSTTAVYGDRAGDWVDEDSALTPATERGRWRVQAEQDWQALARDSGLPLSIFRLAGIYGPGRGPFAKLRDGTARRIGKPGQVFSRIHVDDIATVLMASMARPEAMGTYNVCDDDPAPPQDVIAYAAQLLGLPVPPLQDLASADLSPMARSFYAESKRVRNDRMKQRLGVTLAYPGYRQGLPALLQAEEATEC